MTERRAKIRWWVWLLAGLVLIGIIAALILWWQPIYDFATNEEQVRAWIEKLGAWGPVAIILLETLQALLAPIPGQAIGAVSGYLYGPWLGTLYSMIGIALGSILVFWLARRFGRPLVVRFVGKDSVARLDDLANRGGAIFFFLVWLLPFAPDDLACIAAGLTPMPIRQFLILMLVGRLPGVFAASWVGANATRIEPIWWAVLLAALVVAALVFWRWGDRIQESVLGLVERLSNRFER